MPGKFEQAMPQSAEIPESVPSAPPDIFDEDVEIVPPKIASTPKVSGVRQRMPEWGEEPIPSTVRSVEAPEIPSAAIVDVDIESGIRSVPEKPAAAEFITAKRPKEEFIDRTKPPYAPSVDFPEEEAGEKKAA